ncbi:MAG: cell envelope integrity protein CreD [Pseudomonadota bacterium]
MLSSDNLPAAGWFKDPLTRRGIMVAAMTLAMLIPQAMVHGVVDERGALQRAVVSELSATLGGPQDIVGPVLVIPYTHSTVVEERFGDAQGVMQLRERVTTREREFLLLPEHLDLALALSGEHRRRGIYRVLATTTAMRASGRYPTAAVSELAADEANTVHWARAFLSIGISHPRAIAHVDDLQFNGEAASPAPGTRLQDLLGGGFHAPVDATALASNAVSFDLSLEFQGLGPVRFAPLGAITTTTARSSWPHPSFLGQALPREYSTADSGFEARWEIPQLARSYPQAWYAHLEDPDLHQFVAGVSLFEPVSVYTRVSRSVKYGLLFVLSTFVVLLALELMIGRLLHVAQYALVGVSLTMFFLVLLSLAETIGFAFAYLLASTTTVAMTAAYAGAALGSTRVGGALGVLLAIAYALLYGLLQLEDLALLMGTVVLLVALGLLMMLTRGLSREWGAD